MKPQPIDLEHLSRQTMGDREVAGEVLDLFVQQAGRCLTELGAGGEEGARKAVAHRLLGAARGVGADGVARAAQALEARPADADALATLRIAVSEAEEFIAGLGH